jgi:hypothetical protein
MLQPPMDSSPCCALLHHWSKFHSSASSDPGCPLIHQEKIHPWAPTACADDQELLLSLGKPNHLVWDSRPSGFPILGSFYPAGGWHSRNGHLLRSTLRGQNLQLILTIPGGSTSVTEPKVCITPPKVDKVHTSSVEVPMAQALVARPRSTTPDGNPADDNPDVLNFATVESWIAYRMSSLLKTY